MVTYNGKYNSRFFAKHELIVYSLTSCNIHGRICEPKIYLEKDNFLLLAVQIHKASNTVHSLRNYLFKSHIKGDSRKLPF